jgi:Ca2+-binding EF-hand superfamily protein
MLPVITIIFLNSDFKLHGRLRGLKRFFKQKDTDNNGYVSISDFKEAFKNLDVSLNNEELYVLNTKLDSDMLGYLDYKKFINEYLRDDE